MQYYIPFFFSTIHDTKFTEIHLFILQITNYITDNCYKTTIIHKIAR